MILIRVKAGSQISGHKFEEAANFRVASEPGLQMIAQGVADYPQFDENGRCEINTNWDAIKNAHGAIKVYSGGDRPEFVLPAEFPLLHLPSAVTSFQVGQASGQDLGRRKLQGELRALLGAEAASA